ncbi:MAG: hypothetical protein ABI668_07340 [Sphingorhabdus sp.]
MNDYAMAAPPPRGGMKFKHILILLLIAFVGGVVGTGWLANRLGYWDGNFTSEASPLPKTAIAQKPPFSAVPPPDDTVTSIENRLTQINADAAAASGNAARAEGLLVAFAARRAIDSGAPLGYLADQLRLRFGASQPQAVTTILAASQAPVTIEILQAELQALDNALLTGDRDAGVWATVSREFSDLFVLRKDGAPSPAPTQRLLRAHTLVESGNIGGAIAEVSRMPGVSVAQGWLAKARRYNQARKALDLLERSAIIAPAPAPAPVLTTPVAPAGAEVEPDTSTTAP